MDARFKSICTVLWTPEMGKRLSIARMVLGLTQTELGGLLGVSQGALSKIEMGHVRVVEIPLGLVIESLGKHLEYVLFNANAQAYSPNFIKVKYWKLKLARTPKYEGDAGKKRLLRETRKARPNS